MKRFELALVAIILIAPLAAGAETGAAAAGLERLSALAVQHGGRIKPLSVAASEITAGAATPGVEPVIEGRHRDLAIFLTLSGSPDWARPGLSDLHLFPASGEWLSARSDEAAFAAVTESVVAAWGAGDYGGFADAAQRLEALLAPHYAQAGVRRGRLSGELVLYRLRPLFVAAFAYAVAGALLVVMVRRGARGLSTVVSGAALAVNVAGVALYAWVAGRMPVNNSYEGLLVLSVCLGSFALFSCRSRRFFPAAALAAFMAALSLFGAELTPLQRPITPPVPVLQSLWLQVHVLTCFVAYSAFTVAFAAAVVVLASRGRERAARFDDIAFRSALFGFIFLSTGILTGAMWARQAWGRYWGFDPKETWALVTWLIYAAYLHLGLLGRRRLILRAVAAVIGFLAVIFTFLGVNYLLSGLHSYA